MSRNYDIVPQSYTRLCDPFSSIQNMEMIFSCLERINHRLIHSETFLSFPLMQSRDSQSLITNTKINYLFRNSFTENLGNKKKVQEEVQVKPVN